MNKEKRVAKLVANYISLDYNQKKVTKDLFSNEIKKILKNIKNMKKILILMLIE